MSRGYRSYGAMTAEQALALEAEGDVSYRIRVVRRYGDSEGTVGSAAYPKTLAGVDAAAARLAKKWGPFSDYFAYTNRPTECVVLVEARERKYNWDGEIARGVDAGSWRLVERRTVPVPAKEVAA
jgi:2-keto-3-deoxy-L-rhamnonate aldolase RhmA